jgi:hypothetical protein
VNEQVGRFSSILLILKDIRQHGVAAITSWTDLNAEALRKPSSTFLYASPKTGAHGKIAPYCKKKLLTV